MVVDGRDCGECIECCRFIPIKTELLVKPTNVLCPNCQLGAGCAVYEVRPEVCRGWNCGWRVIETIPLDWRPDRSGLVFRIEDLAERKIAIVVLDPEKYLLSEQFAQLVGGWVDGGIEVAFSAVGPSGSFPSQLIINPVVADALAQRDLIAVQRVFLRIYRAITVDHNWEADGLSLRNDVVSPQG